MRNVLASSDPGHRSPRGRQRGQSLVEFALVLPALLVLVLGAVDYGRLYFDYISVTNAARAAAAYASSSAESATDTSGIANAALDELSGGSDGATVLSATGTDEDGNMVAEVKVQYTFQTLVSWPFLPHAVQLERSVHMRVGSD
jgi:Flp pilus assembly protein TadG